MSQTRRAFIRNIGLGLSAAGAAATHLAGMPEGRTGRSEALLEDNPHHPAPAPVGTDRLPLAWYQDRVWGLKEKCRQGGADAILFATDENIVYFTGCFRSSGERPTWCLFPLDETDAVYWFSPGIDRDLITSWWCTGNDYYFCYPHAAGGFPNKGLVATGKSVDLFAWMLAGLKKRGLSGKTIAADFALTPERKRAVDAILPGARFVDMSHECLAMRIIKTPREIALVQRAYRYFDRIHAFSRDYILERGTDATDFELGQALQSYGINLMMKDIKPEGGPHKAVGVEVTGNYVRAGVATAYPHPNQFFYARIRRGAPVYVNTDIKLGGYGGEGYRNYLIEPRTPRQEKMWHVVADSVRIMIEETRPGRTCADIAAKVHSFQVKSGLKECVYHRPGHGQGQVTEGHQPPFLALGDETEIREGMMFSVEPGLYDQNAGVGVNPSDCLLVTGTSSFLMSRVPISPEWSFLKL